MIQSPLTFSDEHMQRIRDAIARQGPLPQFAYERHWRVNFRDQHGRRRRRKIISTVEETAEQIAAHARKWEPRWKVVSVRAGEILPC
jgi:tRNA U34 5-methylaminomethyl-2-thiouridine-forming methyltransferase MnmC